MDYSLCAAACPSEAGVSAPVFADMFPDALLLDNGADMASLMLGLEKDLPAESQQQQPTGNSSWVSILPAHSAALPLAYDTNPPADKFTTACTWRSSPSIIPDHTAAATTVTAAASTDASPSQGSECTAACDTGFMQLMQDSTPAAPLHTDVSAAGAAAPQQLLPYSVLMLARRESAAGGFSTVQCASPGSAGSPRGCSTGACSAGLLSGSEDSSLQGLDAPAALTTAAAAVGRPVGGSAAAAGVAAGAAAGQNKRKAANMVNQRKMRQKKQEEADHTKEQISALCSKNSALQAKVDTLRADTCSLLARLADITSKWQATVVENARLNQENGHISAQLGELQHQLALARQEADMMRLTLQQQQQEQQQMCVPHHQQQQHHHAGGFLGSDVWVPAGQW